MESVFKNLLKILVAGIGLALAMTANATIITNIDLNDFFADPSVTVAPDGASAVMEEDGFFFNTLLVNDPGLGDPEVIVAAADRTLLFNYLFDMPAGNDDEFAAFILDAATGISLGSGFEFFTSTDGATGTVTFDLSSLTGLTLGLQFALNSDIGFTGNDLLTSVVTISNVRLEDRMSVPEPSVIFLLISGLLLMGFFNRGNSAG